MRTRRKSKQAAAAAAIAELDTETAESVAPSDAPASPSKVEFSVSIPDDLDIEYLSRLLPDISYESPSQDAVLSLYRLILTQAGDLDGALRDLEESRAENERKDVELDQALQDRESSVSSLDVQVKALQEELTRAKQERDTLGESEATLLSGYSPYPLSIISLLIHFCHSLASSKSNLESQISTMSSSQSISSTELDSFKHKVEDIEREKRDLLGVVSRLKEDSAQRDGMFCISFTYRVYSNRTLLEEIQTLRANLKQARQDQQSLETQLREVRSAESSTKVRSFIVFRLTSITLCAVQAGLPLATTTTLQG